ncbi:MAG: HAMP domain-containing histidine kinase [Lachnospiraceae bacterium]|jgi:signal transduction histidine kinase|nr:HAMP domain-containing histidine kinase [Lachnospiraceae bacterium]
MKKKRMIKRLGLELLQHILIVAIMAAVAGLLLNSYIAVESINGTQIYRIFPMNSNLEFEESEIFHDLFRNAVSDITQLVVIKEQLETEDALDPYKKIDVTEYARRIGADQGCAISVTYELDDLIKWGKYGVEYGNRMMSLTEFVNYFGNCIVPENFALDEYGQLVFDEFYVVKKDGDEEGDAPGEQEGVSEETQNQAPPVHGKTPEQLNEISEMLQEYTEEQLVDFAFSHIMRKNLGSIKMSREDDGSLTVSVPMLNCRYATVDGTRQLVNYANNWVDYMQLQSNVEASIKNLTTNYQRYQICNDVYKENNSNVKYMVRMMTAEGMCTYTNVERLKEAEDEAVTEYFSEYRRYLIYYPDSLEFMGNTSLSEEELDNYISVYDYAYPDTTHIWIGIDSIYSVEGDTFHTANAVYQRIVPNVNKILILVAFLALVWLGLGLYLTITAGVAEGAEGLSTGHLNRFDHIWTEILVLIGAGLVYGTIMGFRTIMDISEKAGAADPETMGREMVRLYRYGMFALYGLYVSVSMNLIWYSLVRRVKANSLWRDSLLRWFCQKLAASGRFILRHRNSAVSTLLPYNLFLFLNLFGAAMVYKLWDQKLYALLGAAAVVLFDGIVGVLMFRHGAEQIEIVEGIKRIRDGEVEYKLDSDSLHGSSRDLAEAVNNIGEGIKKAVRTSMKDEQMKTDLITNVSHDIKTPLTSIINYVDLLKRLNIQQEPARGYIDILDGKSQRLKQLTDDLVEVSKITSGSIVLNKERLNLTELVNQAIGEFSERMEECRLQIVFEENDLPAFIYADSSRMWRVAENLFNNICKYAMEGTRVYIDMWKQDGRVGASIKNISSQQMNIRPDELTERFIRGDSARTTEGSGLGLSIAKSLVQVQGGSFEIQLDGDLFKVVISFPESS